MPTFIIIRKDVWTDGSTLIIKSILTNNKYILVSQNRKGGDIRLKITLVPKVFNQVYMFIGSFKEFLLVACKIVVSKLYAERVILFYHWEYT